MESQSVIPPRSVVLALWARDLADGVALLPDAVRAVRGDDEPHRLGSSFDGAPRRGEDDDAELRTLLTIVSSPGTSTVAALPAPGDPAGVPAEASAAATEAGECLLVESTAGAFALVPSVVRFGSAWEPGHLVTWDRVPVSSWERRFYGVVGDVSEADRALRTALITATRALADLDVARWREDVGDELAALRGENLGWPLPPRVEATTARVTSLATRLRRIVELATDDDGGAASLWQADQRSAALGEVDRAARRALAAATLTVR
ncbi:hypothetical protein [Paraoerskovia marina]|uniref:hypothetical protein n=1 Tax=Paraoerskovia marina TaxID=545619 RepID=UPI000694D5BD|nr:hypothetical protein [Paraoerskovia marina]